MAIISGRNGRLVATDLGDDIYIQLLPETLQPPLPSLVTFSGTKQLTLAIAAGANGYAVAWNEYGTDGFNHKYVRRFSGSGSPQDATLTLVASSSRSYFAALPTAIVSNGETYLVGWQTDTDYLVRRLDATTGDWIDPGPFALGLGSPVSLASNGTDALAFGGAACGNTPCLAAQRIALSGPPLTSPAVNFRTLAPYTSSVRAIESNGTDYLAVWFESPFCMFDPCLPIPGPVFAMRLRADGTAIDAQPLKLSAQDRAVSNLSAAWADGRYLVAWSDFDVVRGTRVTDEGAVSDRDPIYGGVLLAAAAKPTEIYSLTPVVVGVGRRFALLLNRVTRVDSLYGATLEGVAFDARAADLSFVPALPHTVIAPAASGYPRNLAAASRGYTLATAYDLPTAEAGNVSRVVLRLFAEPIPRRRATR
jgi:hypothetical protein